jgi:hypothetical protein
VLSKSIEAGSPAAAIIGLGFAGRLDSECSQKPTMIHEEMIERAMDCTCGWKWNNDIKCKLVSNAEFTITAMLGKANSTM